jgi:hypothetical protein
MRFCGLSVQDFLSARDEFIKVFEKS